MLRMFLIALSLCLTVLLLFFLAASLVGFMGLNLPADESNVSAEEDPSRTMPPDRDVFVPVPAPPHLTTAPDDALTSAADPNEVEDLEDENFVAVVQASAVSSRSREGNGPPLGVLASIWLFLVIIVAVLMAKYNRN
ncbi:MAG: hypothetical protein F4Y22_02605 [Gammaproteobacteria bacterium]|nr:hypothetical protein [Gammaproteobacteria bacterium]MYH46271.1 hypothetical protein [Gammaproteobacteria bacterium]MYL13886.1 hypothetical protein [Gammaproteobacteria bacterium]